MGMNWEGKDLKTGSAWHLGFNQKHGNTLFKIQIVGSVPQGLTEKELTQFTKHKRSGIDPFNHSIPNWLKANVTPKDLKKIDVIVTVGLASDESGFLAWDKQHNPKGTIIAINLVKPSYLSKNDILVIGNAKIVLPTLLKKLKSKESMSLSFKH